MPRAIHPRAAPPSGAVVGQIHPAGLIQAAEGPQASQPQAAEEMAAAVQGRARRGRRYPCCASGVIALKTLSVVIPVYNERPTLKALLCRVLKVDSREGLFKDIIVVDDGSTDGSREWIAQLTERWREFLEEPLRRRGLDRSAAQRAPAFEDSSSQRTEEREPLCERALPS